MLKFIISIFMMCAACCATDFKEYSYPYNEVMAFKETLQEWSPVLREISHSLTGKTVPGQLTVIYKELGAYDAAIGLHYDAAEYVTIAWGRMHTEANLYRFSGDVNKGVWSAADLKQAIDEHMILINSTLSFLVSFLDAHNSSAAADSEFRDPITPPRHRTILSCILGCLGLR